MNAIRLLPVIVSMLLLGAHFYRSGHAILVLLCVALPLLLFIRRPWVVRLMQAFLVIGVLEWVRTVIRLAQVRMETGMPWTRLVLILGAVALFTAASAMVFRSGSLRKRYRIDGGSEAKFI